MPLAVKSKNIKEARNHKQNQKDLMYYLSNSDKQTRGVTGGDLQGTGETVPKKFEVGDGSCIRPPIFREVLLLDVR